MKHHSCRVAAVVPVLCECIGMGRDGKAEMVLSAYLHDIGKWWIPGSILRKSGPLDPNELRRVREHTTAGAKILEDCGLHRAAAVALAHHEAWDGSGYPHGLEGQAIPFPARVVALCDVYSALREERPYRVRLSHDAALSAITEGDGRTRPEMFDPELLATFSDNHQRMSEAFDVADQFPQTSVMANALPFAGRAPWDGPDGLHG